MLEFIYSENGKYYKEITDLCYKTLLKKRITKKEYNKIKKKLTMTS